MPMRIPNNPANIPTFDSISPPTDNLFNFSINIANSSTNKFKAFTASGKNATATSRRTRPIARSVKPTPATIEADPTFKRTNENSSSKGINEAFSFKINSNDANPPDIAVIPRPANTKPKPIKAIDPPKAIRPIEAPIAKYPIPTNTSNAAVRTPKPFATCSKGNTLKTATGTINKFNATPNRAIEPATANSIVPPPVIVAINADNATRTVNTIPTANKPCTNLSHGIKLKAINGTVIILSDTAKSKIEAIPVTNPVPAALANLPINIADTVNAANNKDSSPIAINTLSHGIKLKVINGPDTINKEVAINNNVAIPFVVALEPICAILPIKIVAAVSKVITKAISPKLVNVFFHGIKPKEIKGIEINNTELEISIINLKPLFVVLLPIFANRPIKTVAAVIKTMIELNEIKPIPISFQLIPETNFNEIVNTAIEPAIDLNFFIFLLACFKSLSLTVDNIPIAPTNSPIQTVIVIRPTPISFQLIVLISLIAPANNNKVNPKAAIVWAVPTFDKKFLIPTPIPSPTFVNNFLIPLASPSDVPSNIFVSLAIEINAAERTTIKALITLTEVHNLSASINDKAIIDADNIAIDTAISLIACALS